MIIIYKNMKIISIISVFSIVATITLMCGVTQFSTFVNAQTPTTSDLPATIGNESNTDMALTNNTLPVENATTINPGFPN
jgi:hypothetical protein